MTTWKIIVKTTQNVNLGGVGTVHLEKGTTHVVIEGMTESAEGTSFSLHFPENIKGSAIRLETAVCNHN